jgi:hypothetical protein
MKRYLFKFFQIALFTYAILVTIQLIECNSDNKKHNHNSDKTNNHVEHSGIINVNIIDKNKNGKVYQDQMDWNVISDVPGECSICGMTLKEVTIQDAEENLVQNGFEIK